MKKSLVIANLSWNSSHWKEPMINPKAHHSYATKFPGHESLNFDFTKSTDISNAVYGYVETKGTQFRQFENGGIFLFYSYNTDRNIGEIIGIFGNVETLYPYKESYHVGFQDQKLLSNIRADKDLSILFPIFLKSEKYKKYTNGKRLDGQLGFQYYDNKNLFEEVIYDEINQLMYSGTDYSQEIAILKNIYKYFMDQEFDFDVLEQQSIIDNFNEIPDLEDENAQTKTVQNTTYTRNNILIAKIKKERNFECQICKIKIQKRNGNFYIEAAHIKAKKDKGNEKKENILILCPNHHKEFDYGNRETLIHTKNIFRFKLNDIEYELSLK